MYCNLLEEVISGTQRIKLREHLNNKENILVVGDSYGARSEMMMWLTENIPKNNTIACAEYGDILGINSIHEIEEYEPCLRLEDGNKIDSISTSVIDWVVLDEIGGKWGLRELDRIIYKGTSVVATLEVNGVGEAIKKLQVYSKNKSFSVIVHVDIDKDIAGDVKIVIRDIVTF